MQKTRSLSLPRLYRENWGVLHSTAGYILYASMTHKFVFDYNDGDIYWCTADVGWVTGHSYIVYGPLAMEQRLYV